MKMRFYLLITTAVTIAAAQQYTTPVPILKQINKQNEDGSYSYGYEAADGTYKIETKYPDGQVFGKYGFIDDQGKLRTVEYGASRRGFEPAGNEIQVPPPTLKSTNQNARPLGPDDEDDGQYREDPGAYYKNEPYTKSQSRYPQSIYRQPPFDPQPVYTPQQAYAPRRNYNPPPQPQPQPAYQPSFRPQTSFNQFPSYPTQPSYYNPPPQRSYYNPPPTPAAYPNYNNAFQGHPASNVDIWSGSYSVNYRK